MRFENVCKKEIVIEYRFITSVRRREQQWVCKTV